MRSSIRISDVRFKPVGASAGQGLLGFVSLVIDDVLVVGSIAVRRTRAGEKRLSWPCRRDLAGREHTVVAPLDEAARLRLEEQVFIALDLDHEGAL